MIPSESVGSLIIYLKLYLLCCSCRSILDLYPVVYSQVCPTISRENRPAVGVVKIERVPSCRRETHSLTCIDFCGFVPGPKVGGWGWHPVEILEIDPCWPMNFLGSGQSSGHLGPHPPHDHHAGPVHRSPQVPCSWPRTWRGGAETGGRRRSFRVRTLRDGGDALCYSTVYSSSLWRSLPKRSKESAFCGGFLQTNTGQEVRDRLGPD